MNIWRPYKEKENASLALHIKLIPVYLEKAKAILSKSSYFIAAQWITFGPY